VTDDPGTVADDPGTVADNHAIRFIILWDPWLRSGELPTIGAMAKPRNAMRLFSVPALDATCNVPFPQWGDVGVEKHPLPQMVRRQGHGRLLSTDPEGKDNPV
jgi:hypothetical protein